MSNRWIPITSEDLRDAKAAALVEALQTGALGEGQDDPTPEITASAIARIRAEIKASPSHQLDAGEDLIPRSLKALATRMILREMQSRLQMPLTSEEQQQLSQDEQHLSRVARGEVAVEDPDTPADSAWQVRGGIEVTSTSTRHATRTQTQGL